MVVAESQKPSLAQMYSFFYFSRIFLSQKSNFQHIFVTKSFEN